MYLPLARTISMASRIASLDMVDDVIVLDCEMLVNLCCALGGQQDHLHVDVVWCQHNDPL